MADASKYLLEIGSQCAHPNCNEVDFLPIACQHCPGTYCRHHIPLEAHQCKANPAAINPSVPFEKLDRCAVESCNKPSLRYSTDDNGKAPTCSQCQRSFCADHRYPDSHSCPNPEPTSTEASSKTSATRAMLEKNFPRSTNKQTSTRTTKIPTDPKKLAAYRKVELMKMRHSAVPGNPKDSSPSVPMDDRLHVKMQKDQVEKVYWFRKSTVTGKVLDSLGTHQGVPSTDISPIQLTNDGRILQNDKPISEEVEDGALLVFARP